MQLLRCSKLKDHHQELQSFIILRLKTSIQTPLRMSMIFLNWLKMNHLHLLSQKEERLFLMPLNLKIQSLISIMTSLQKHFQLEFFKNAEASTRIWKLKNFWKSFGPSIHFKDLNHSYMSATERVLFKQPSTIMLKLGAFWLSILRVK